MWNCRKKEVGERIQKHCGTNQSRQKTQQLQLSISQCVGWHGGTHKYIKKYWKRKTKIKLPLGKFQWEHQLCCRILPSVRWQYTGNGFGTHLWCMLLPTIIKWMFMKIKLTLTSEFFSWGTCNNYLKKGLPLFSNSDL